MRLSPYVWWRQILHVHSPKTSPSLIKGQHALQELSNTKGYQNALTGVRESSDSSTYLPGWGLYHDQNALTGVRESSDSSTFIISPDILTKFKNFLKTNSTCSLIDNFRGFSIMIFVPSSKTSSSLFVFHVITCLLGGLGASILRLLDSSCLCDFWNLPTWVLRKTLSSLFVSTTCSVVLELQFYSREIFPFFKIFFFMRSSRTPPSILVVLPVKAWVLSIAIHKRTPKISAPYNPWFQT